MQIVLTKTQIDQKITRLAHQIIENSYGESHIFIGGICGNGKILANALGEIIKSNSDLELTIFEINLHKDQPLQNEINLSVDSESLKDSFIVLVDDVLNSGKTMQYALMKLLEKPVKAIKTVSLVDRRHRRYPIKADFVGITLTTTLQERVEMDLTQEDYFAYLV
jgi:pyrimidine operon attenuation protein / uracil phosphoribosyltransferase